jgi:tetratricopeptide (TPR) repeat protein
MQAGNLVNPFPGLRSFEPEEDHLFFGREKQVDELLRRLRSSRFLSVIGTSGSGKSSLIRCGLIPSLHSGFMVNAGPVWRVAVLRPGDDPLKNLAESLNARDVLGTSEDQSSTNRVLLDVTLRRSTLGLVEAFRQAQIPHQENLLVVIDQFEELFRFRHSCQNANFRDEAVAFVKLLLEAIHQEDVPIYVVLTMRSDFIGDCMEYPGLPEAVNAGLYLVPRMTRDELRSAISGPMAVGGGQIAPRLVLRLLNDVGDDRDQLPVLQHALMRTWDHWQHSGDHSEPMDVADYESIGTLERALSLHAEEAYQETGSDNNRHITERIFKALTDTYSDPRGVRRPTSIRELAAICEATEPEVIQIIEIFRERGRCFLMPPIHVPLDSRSIIDISHESLMRCWQSLIAWAEEERRSADFYMRLSKASAWFEEKTGGLWRDPELEFGLRWWMENNPTLAWSERYDGSFMRVVDFLDLSKNERDRAAAAKAKERRRKLRLTQWAAGVLAVLLIGVGYLAYLAREESNRAENNLVEARTAADDVLAIVGSQSTSIADMPEMIAFRQQLLAQSQAFYKDFASQESSNEGVRAGMALSNSRLGDIDRMQGKLPDAESLYNKAIGQYASLANDYPSKPEYREGLGYVYNFLGETLRVQNGRSSDAGKAYDNALQVQQPLASANPGNAQYHQKLARTYYNRGILRFATQLPADSESDFNQAIQLLLPLVPKATDPSTAEELARVYNNLGNLLRAKGKDYWAEATKDFTSAISTDEAVVKNNPSIPEYKLELAYYYDNYAMLLMDENQLDQAQKNNLQTLDLVE